MIGSIIHLFLGNVFPIVFNSLYHYRRSFAYPNITSYVARHIMIYYNPANPLYRYQHNPVYPYSDIMSYATRHIMIYHYSVNPLYRYQHSPIYSYSDITPYCGLSYHDILLSGCYDILSPFVILNLRLIRFRNLK